MSRSGFRRESRLHIETDMLQHAVSHIEDHGGRDGLISGRPRNLNSVDDLLHSVQLSHSFLSELLLVEAGEMASKEHDAFPVLQPDLASGRQQAFFEESLSVRRDWYRYG